MRKNKRSEYRQSYNAQAAVDANGAMLVLSAPVSQNAGDAPNRNRELVPTVAAIPTAIGKLEISLADTGYANGWAVAALENDGMEVLVAIGGDIHRRRHDLRPTKPRQPPREITAEWRKKMKQKMDSPAGRAKYAKRKQTVEPVFGIIKHGMKFRRFPPRGIEKMRGEWRLVTLAYNRRRLHTLILAASGQHGRIASKSAKSAKKYRSGYLTAPIAPARAGVGGIFGPKSDRPLGRPTARARRRLLRSTFPRIGIIKQTERLLALWGSIEALSKTVAPSAMFELPMRSSRIDQLRQ